MCIPDKVLQIYVSSLCVPTYTGGSERLETELKMNEFNVHDTWGTHRGGFTIIGECKTWWSSAKKSISFQFYCQRLIEKVEVRS